MVAEATLASPATTHQVTMSKFIVNRTVHLVQAITVKANSSTEAIALARKSKFKDFVSVNNKKRTDYSATKLAA